MSLEFTTSFVNCTTPVFLERLNIYAQKSKLCTYSKGDP